MNNKLQTKDLINLGLFTVLYFVIGCAYGADFRLAWRPDFEIRRL